MSKSVKEQIVEWNNRFPIDKWWRDKHNVAFNSQIHRETSFLDQLFEYQEENLFKESRKSTDYKPNVGEFLKPQKRTEKEKTMSLAEEARKELDEMSDLINKQ